MTTRLYNNDAMYPRADTRDDDRCAIPTEEQMEALAKAYGESGLTNAVLFGTGDNLKKMLNLAVLKTMATFRDPLATYERAGRKGGNRVPQLMADPRVGRRNRIEEFFLPVVDPSINNLAMLIAWAMPYAYKFVRPEDLLPEYGDLIRESLEKVRLEARVLLIGEVLTGFAEAGVDLWYLNGSRGKPGGWQMSSSLMSEFGDLQRTLKGLPALHPHFRTPYNDSSWHGRPRRDRKNGTVEGTSIGRERHSQLR